MTLTEHRLQVQNEMLKDALGDAIDYLKLMPQVPITQAKIVELEMKLRIPLGGSEFEAPVAWKNERFTPAGQHLRVIVENGEIRFEIGVPLESGSQVCFPLNLKQIDAIIAALASQRQNIQATP